MATIVYYLWTRKLTSCLPVWPVAPNTQHENGIVVTQITHDTKPYYAAIEQQAGNVREYKADFLLKHRQGFLQDIENISLHIMVPHVNTEDYITIRTQYMYE